MFVVVCRFIFVKKAKDQLDSQFHQYLPGNEKDAQAQLDEPSALIIIDALNSKDAPEKLIDYADTHSSAVFAKCIIVRTKKSLEHLKSTVERYRKVFDHCFAGDNQ